MRRLEGKVALVPGSGSGLGRAAALRFAAEGALVVGGDTDHIRASETQRLIGRAGGIALHPEKLDVTDPDSVQAWAREAVDAFGAIDVLLAHAPGPAPRDRHIEAQPFDDYAATLRGRLDAVWLCAKAVWPHLTLGEGCIVMVASTAAVAGCPGRGLGAQAAAAGGIVALSRQLAAEGAALGVRVNCVSPGGIDLDGADRAGPPAEAPPIGRAGRADDVLNAAVFLASGEASFVTGAHLVVDGGWSAVRPG
ncbi:SDR family NAD(P)-dependent oxidoreductase [Streptomyces sp. NPDC016845]|uniref:SDR family NAD(P)-dependent oxidoreductase n=1 Tax=Streptomyces sp. NPDC016845 TaxID=3364972 RepID=UPI0037B8444C